MKFSEHYAVIDYKGELVYQSLNDLFGEEVIFSFPLLFLFRFRLQFLFYFVFLEFDLIDRTRRLKRVVVSLSRFAIWSAPL